MNLSNLHGLPDSIVAAIMNDPYSGGGDISATRLIDSPQRRVLTKKFGASIVEDVSERFFSLLGQAVHAVLERAEPSAVVEQRLYHNVNGWELSGAFDRLDLKEKSLDDYKVTSVFNYGPKKEWVEQLNILRYLAIKNGYEVDRLRIIALFRNWSEGEMERKQDYPPSPMVVIEIPVWPLEDTEAFIKERITLHQKADAGEFIPCTDEERWATPTTYALKKEGGKRAIKIFASKEEAGDIPDGMVLEERAGRFRRCEKYCKVAPFCPQWEADPSRKQASTEEWEGDSSS